MTRLFIPGPVDVDPEVAAAQTRDMLPHRSEEFEILYRRTWDKASHLFATSQRVFIITSSGTGLHEAAVRNLANGDVLSCVNGAFGQRWHQVALSNGKSADQLEADWGQPILPDQVAGALRKKSYEIVTVVHNETSTGLENPLREIAAAVQETSPETLVCVDAVSSLGGVEIDMDGWGLDFVLSSSQKCIALPPGLSLAAVSDRAMARVKQVPNRGWYFDLARLERHLLKDSTPATPAISLIYAHDLQMDRMLAEGLEKRFKRHSDMAALVQEWALEQGLDLYAAEGYRSKTVTAVLNTLDLDIAALNAYLMKKDMRIANGYGPLKDKTFRIAHMGETQIKDLEQLLKRMEKFIQSKVTKAD
jgi:aspartate aminotransferase-like enzyme